MNDMTATPNHGTPLWNLADLYPTADAWSVEYARIKKAAAALDSHKGTLGKGAATMLKATPRKPRTKNVSPEVLKKVEDFVVSREGMEVTVREIHEATGVSKGTARDSLSILSKDKSSRVEFVTMAKQKSGPPAAVYKAKKAGDDGQIKSVADLGK